MTPLEEQLFDAVQSEDRAAFMRALRRGAGVNARTIEGVTPLHGAAFHGWLREVKWLLKHGADADARTTRQFFKRRAKRRKRSASSAKRRVRRQRGETPLEWAAQRINNDVIMGLLLPHTHDAAVRRVKGWSAWHLAIVRGDDERAIRLLQKRRDLNRPNLSDYRPLEVAAQHGRLAVAEYLLQRGAKATRGKDAYTPLHEAARRGHYEVAKLLLEHGAPVNAWPYGEGATPLHEAVYGGHARVAALLLKHGANVTFSHWGGEPIHSAAARGNTTMVRLLLRYGADPNAIDYQHETPLYCVARKGAVAAMRVLIEHGAKVNWRDADSFTPLHSAAIAGQAEAMKLLLRHGANFEARGRNCHLSLLYVCEAPRPDHWITQWERGMRGGLCPPPPEDYLELPPPRSNRRYYARYVETVRLLLEGGANPNVREKETRATPLHYAALRGDADIARLLIEHDAKLSMLDCDGQSPLAVAECCGHDEVAGVLRAHGAKSVGGLQDKN